MKSLRIRSLVIVAMAFMLTGCEKGADLPASPSEQPLEITDHFVAGTLAQKNGSKYTSVFFIRFLEDGKALFISSASNNLVGNYRWSETEIVFEVTGGNSRIARFNIDENNNITAAYYKALETEYETTAMLLPITESNQLAGKVFEGEEYKMGQEQHRAGLIYDFHSTFPTYDSGTSLQALDNTAKEYTLIGGSAFKYVRGKEVELGFISNQALTVFRVSGLYFYGVYDQQ